MITHSAAIVRSLYGCGKPNSNEEVSFVSHSAHHHFRRPLIGARRLFVGNFHFVDGGAPRGERMKTPASDDELIALCRRLIHYDKVTGICTWKDRQVSDFKYEWAFRRWNTMHAVRGPIGSVRVSHCGKSYLCVCIFSKTYILHRLIFGIVEGYFPEQVDHQDGNGINNVWKNLIAANQVSNSRNNRKRDRKDDLPTGVYRSKKLFCAAIRVNNVLICLGHFKTVPEAAFARKAAEKKFGFHPNHGQIRPL